MVTPPPLLPALNASAVCVQPPVIALPVLLSCLVLTEFNPPSPGNRNISPTRRAFSFLPTDYHEQAHTSIEHILVSILNPENTAEEELHGPSFLLCELIGHLSAPLSSVRDRIHHLPLGELQEEIGITALASNQVLKSALYRRPMFIYAARQINFVPAYRS